MGALAAAKRKAHVIADVVAHAQTDFAAKPMADAPALARSDAAAEPKTDVVADPAAQDFYKTSEKAYEKLLTLGCPAAVQPGTKPAAVAGTARPNDWEQLIRKYLDELDDKDMPVATGDACNAVLFHRLPHNKVSLEQFEIVLRVVFARLELAAHVLRDVREHHACR